MSENFKTIKELADELGVSKQGVRYHMKSIPQEELKKNNKGIVVLNIEQQNFIKRKAKSDTAVSGKLDTAVSGKSDTAVRYKQEISFLEEKNLLKDNQIDYLKQQIKNYENQANNLIEVQKQTQNLLDQQQRLALQDKKLLEEYKAENDRLKVLKMPSQETEFKHLDNQYKDEVNALKEKLENLQEQIKVQKRIEEQEKPRKWWELWRK